MGRKKKPFINKKTAVIFTLGHRSQKDPLISTDASPYVLIPENEPSSSAAASGVQSNTLSEADRLKEQKKYGIFFDDDYDYLQHLKDTNELTKLDLSAERYRVYPADEKNVEDGMIVIPSSLLGCCSAELKVGILNQAAPQPGPHPELDPDIVAALEGDFDFDDPELQLEDDFFMKANLPEDEKIDDSHAEYGCFGPKMDFTERHYKRQWSDDGDDDTIVEDVRSKLSCFSMSSSAMRRSADLKELDKRFEVLLNKQYKDEIEEDECDESEESEKDDLIDVDEKEKEEIKRKTLDYLNYDEKERTVLIEDEQKKPRWDCESVLKCKGPIILDKKRGLPIESMKSKESGDEVYGQLRKRKKVEAVLLAASNVRKRHETTEEKRLRKQIVKLERKKRRTEKSINKANFKVVEMNMKLAELQAIRSVGLMKLA
ncbi:protein LTV1-like protein [Trichinella spiralis]|uniref:protein LTV1-like protein n=1 Tax=Trichinella spiralis TaxID=6334 RepID=UPI0001EFB4F2|nr:protein LTV1-like protein [Trichinella spiralis]